MVPSLSWQDLLFLNSITRPAPYLKMISEVWGIRVKSIVEIGVFQGTTSQEFRVLFPEAVLFLVDPWKLYEEYRCEEAGPIRKKSAEYEKAYQLVKKSFKGDPKVNIIRKTSIEAVKDVPDEVDLVFIDGNHSYSYVKQDIHHWLPKIRTGGMLSGHDYSKLFPGVIKAVDEFFPQKVLIGHATTWLVRKDS